MKNKIKNLLSILLVVVIAFSNSLTAFAKDSRSVQYFNDVINYNRGSNSVQSWIDSTLSSDAGYGSEWYILSLSQNEKVSGQRYNYSKFESSLIDYTKRVKNINPVSKLRISLALASIGSTNSFISDTMNSAIGSQGIMSYIFGLHLLNNGYKSNNNTKNSVTNKLLNMQSDNGGWGLYGGSDVDVTAMAIQSLAPQYNNNSSVKSSINNALNYLSSEQNANGTFSTINGGSKVETCESTAQVILALSCLTIDCASDSRFIKNGNTPFDGLAIFKSGNGFCHVENGSINSLAMQQVCYSMVGYNRMSNLYLLDKARPNEVETTDNGNNNTISKENNNNNNSNNSNGSSANNKGGKSNSIGNTNSNTSLDSTNSKNGENISDNNSTTDANSTTGLSSEDGEITTALSDAENDADGTNEIENNSVSNTNSKSNYKVWAIISIILICLIVSGILYFTKKGNKGNYIIICTVGIIAILIILLTNFESVGAHKDNVTQKDDVIGTVTIAISCDTIKDETDNEFISSDGVILETTSIDICENETVYDVLNDVCIENEIALETTGTTESIYVEGINHIYELDYGDLSGWMYHVNGDEPSVSCGSYTLKDGDDIEWLYTKNLGQDLA